MVIGKFVLPAEPFVNFADRGQFRLHRRRRFTGLEIFGIGIKLFGADIDEFLRMEFLG